jgi:tetratricopeptide (TPR) repeat protein
VLLLIGAAAAVCFAQPDGLSVHTWVREDIFAGLMAGDMERFNQGRAKIKEILDKDPNNINALGWEGGALLFDASRAFAAGNHAEAARLIAKARELTDRSTNQNRDVGPIATLAASHVYLGERFPEPHKTEAIRRGRELFLQLRQAQEQMLDRLPLHIKGELLAGLAQSADRLGMNDTAAAELRDITNRMPGTVYASRAQRWLDNPGGSRPSMVCLTCHEPGRLENARQRQTAPGAP